MKSVWFRSISVIALLCMACSNPLGNVQTDSNHFPSVGDESGTTPTPTPTPVVEETLPVTSGLLLRYVASEITGFSNGDRVPTWVDSSGKSNDGTQATTNQQPKFLSAANGINGKAALQFGDANELTSIASPTFNLTNRTIIVVLEISGAPPFTTGPVFLQKDGVGTNDYGLDGRTKFNMNYPTGAIKIGTANYTGTVIATFIVDTVATEVYIDGTLDAQDTVAATATNGAVVFGGDGGGNVTNGKIADVLVYSRALTSTERQSVETFLNNIYSAF